MSNKKQKTNINGWLCVDKPYGMNSTKIVSIIKRLTKARKVGHAGTLDPLASGILPIALGEATKTIQFAMDNVKTYEFTIKFGTETATDDIEGEIVASCDKIPTLAEIKNVLPEFIGKIQQVPPAYSAIKVNGKRAYDLARSGQEVELKSRIVRIDDLQIIKGDLINQQCTLRAICGKGTYIRSLGRDIARRLGSLGHITYLRRTQVSVFNEENAICLDFFQNLIDITPSLQESVEKIEEKLLPVDIILDDIPVLYLDKESVDKIRNGIAIKVNQQFDKGQKICAYYEDKLIAFCEIQPDSLVKSVRGFNL